MAQQVSRIQITVLAILISLLLSFCMSKSDDRKFKISHLQEITLEEGAKTTENYYAVFYPNNDTLVIYQTAIDDENQLEKKYKYTIGANSKNSNSIELILKEDDQTPEKLKVAFEKNAVLINDDIYKVNEAYFKFLKQKVLIEKSILEIANLAEDGLGDYAEFLKPINKNWSKSSRNKKFQLLSVTTKNKNYQTDNQYFKQHVTYTYDKLGNLAKAESENFNKVKTDETAKFIKYKIQKSEDRAASEIELYQNKKTLLDSISVQWEQFSTAKEYSYIQYQSKLDTKFSQAKLSDKEIIKLFK